MKSQENKRTDPRNKYGTSPEEANRLRIKNERDKYILPDEYRKILDKAKKTSHRDYFLLFLCGHLGLRVSELINLTMDNFEYIENNMVTVRTLKQKTNPHVRSDKDSLMVSDDTKSVISEYLKKYHSSLSGSDRIFPIVKRTAQNVFNKYVIRCGLNLRYSIHSLRHFRGISLWESTKDLVFVQKQMRHRSMSSTSVYMHISPEKQRELAEKSKTIK